MLNILLYTHTDCNDVCKIFFKQNEKYLPENKGTILINSSHYNIPSNYEKLIYSDNLNYTDRVLQGLNEIDENKIVLFIHEDMFLYKRPKLNLLYDFVDLIDKDQAHFIRLNKSSFSEPLQQVSLHPNLIECHKNNLFCIQPTLGKIKNFKRVFLLLKNNNSYSFELKISNLLEKTNIKSFMISYPTDIKRGLYHWDSEIFPYIATAVCKGKWNSEYKDILLDIHKDNNINSDIRGFTCV